MAGKKKYERPSISRAKLRYDRPIINRISKSPYETFLDGPLDGVDNGLEIALKQSRALEEKKSKDLAA